MNAESKRTLSLIKFLGTIDGRKKIQKIIFILQNEGVNFGKNFKYATYGPYSVDLQIELGNMVNSNVLKEEMHDQTYIYSFDDDNKYLKLDDIDEAITEKKELINSLNGMETRDLEVLSTVYFLKNKGPEYQDDKIVKKKIIYLKPHLEDRIDKALTTYHSIINNGSVV